MTGKQANLEQIKAAKLKYDKQVQDIDAEARAKKIVAKQPLITLIREGLEAGASQNMIATKGMGYAGLSPLKSFLGATGTKLEDLLSAVSVGAESGYSGGSNAYTVTHDSTNSTFHYITRVSDGQKFTLYEDGKTIRWNSFETSDAAQITNAIQEAFGSDYSVIDGSGQ